MTPPRLCELRCPCGQVHWEIDMDFPDMTGTGVPYSARRYRCPACDRQGDGFRLLRQAPPGFLIGLRDMQGAHDPDRETWLNVLREHFPDRLPRKPRVGWWRWLRSWFVR